MGTGGWFPGGKVAGAWSWSHTTKRWGWHLCSYASAHPCVFMAQCVIKYMDNLACYILKTLGLSHISDNWPFSDYWFIFQNCNRTSVMHTKCLSKNLNGINHVVDWLKHIDRRTGAGIVRSTVATKLRAGRPRSREFDFRWDQEVISFSITFRSAPGPTFTMGPGGSFLRGKAVWLQLCLVPRSRMVELYLPSPIRLNGGMRIKPRDNLLYLFIGKRIMNA
jgi:hypothetical protein